MSRASMTGRLVEWAHRCGALPPMRITASWSRSRWDLPNTSMWRDAQRPIGELPSNRPSTDMPDTGSQVKNLAIDGKHPIQIVCHGPALAGFERQARLGSVESLDLRLLVDGQHDGMCRRAHIEADKQIVEKAT